MGRRGSSSSPTPRKRSSGTRWTPGRGTMSMAASADLLEKPDIPQGLDEPRTIDPGLATADRVFHHSARGVASSVLLLTASIGLFLGYQAIPTLQHYGLKFFTESQWEPRRNIVGLAAVIPGTVEVALIALAVGFPLALLTALYISEYSPQRLRPTLVALLDLMAGVPSIVF